MVAVQSAADFFAAGILRPTEERAETELLHSAHHCIAVSRRDHEIDVIHVSRAKALVERRFERHAFGDHEADAANGEHLRDAYRLAPKHLDLPAIPFQS